MTTEQLIEIIKLAEIATGQKGVYFILFADGSGSLENIQNVCLFDFENERELKDGVLELLKKKFEEK